MTSVALYSEQPVLAAGLQDVMAGLEDITLSGVFTALDPLIERVKECRPSVVLLEVTADVTFTTLSELKSAVGGSPIVLWVDTATTDFASRALGLGVRGILRKSLPTELQVKCLRTVAQGELWLEQTLCNRLLTSRRIVLTQRQCQLLSLLLHGLKNKEIACAMNLTHGTVKVNLSRLLRKVGVRDRFELALFALKNLLADAGPEAESARAAVESPSQAEESSPLFFLPNLVTGEHPAACHAMTAGIPHDAICGDWANGGVRPRRRARRTVLFRKVGL